MSYKHLIKATNSYISDIQTLSRLTGKDFTGPTPEIRAPVLPRLAEPINEPSANNSTAELSREKRGRKKSRTPSAAGDAEVLGDIDSFEI